MKKTNSLIILFVASIFFCCTFTTTYTNREKDKAEAETIADKFFNYVKQNNYPATFQLFSPRLLKESPEDKIYEIYNYSRRHLGNLKKTTLIDWETKLIEGTNNSANYTLKYENTYDSSLAIETFRLTKDDQKQIKITAYHINSDIFYKQ